MPNVFKVLLTMVAALTGWWKCIDILWNCVISVSSVEIIEIVYVIIWSLFWVMMIHHWGLNGKNRSTKSEVPE